MRSFQKIIFVTVGLMIAASLVASVLLFVANSKEQDDGYTKTIVFIGDSISEGILGPSPFSERDSDCYYAIVGRSNNYRYFNYSVSGDTVNHFYARLTNTDTPSLLRQYWLSQADIIHISILGNNLLGGDLGKTAVQELQSDYTEINKIFATASQYFNQSIGIIRELNPDATILVNTLYNPLDAAGNLLTSSQKQAIAEAGDGTLAMVREAGARLITKLNGIIYDYLADNPGAYEIIDVYTSFDNLYNENYEKGTALLYGDWLHPSNQGHALMAKLIQDKLVSLGLADNGFALTRYKTLRLEQLERLYCGTSVNINAAKYDIASADSFLQATDAYFGATKGVLPIYTGKPITRRKGEVFGQERAFYINAINVGTDDYGGFIDGDQSKLSFLADGTFTITLVPSELLFGLANIGLGLFLLEDMDISGGLGKANFDTDIEVFLDNIFPGFDLRYLRHSLGLLTSVGVYVGLDFQDPSIAALADSLQQNMVIPAGITLPDSMYIQISGNYFVQTAGGYTNIYMCVGNVSQDGYPFLYGTLHTPKDGLPWLEMSIEVSKITVTAAQKSA